MNVLLRNISVVTALCVSTLGVTAVSPTVTTLFGTGVAGDSDSQVNGPIGPAIGPDGALYFAEYGNHRVRRLDLRTKRVTTIVGNGERAYRGDGGPAVEASLNMPFDLRFDAEGDLYIADGNNNAVRKVDHKTGIISTVAGTGEAGYSGDGKVGIKAQLNGPRCVVFDREGRLLICDVNNNRIRRVSLDTGVIETYAGTGETTATPEGAPVKGTPLSGPRTLALAPNGDLYVVIKEGTERFSNELWRIDVKTQTLHRIAGGSEAGYSGDGGPALQAKLGGPKGLSFGPGGYLYLADTENHVIRRIDMKTGIISSFLGTGEPGDGPESAPLSCKLSRPHGVVAVKGAVYVTDTAHRIRVLH